MREEAEEEPLPGENDVEENDVKEEKVENEVSVV